MKQKLIANFMELVKIILLTAYCLLPAVSFAQDERKYVKEGNKLYEQKKYSAADSLYRKALSKSGDTSYRAQFNLGDALYKQNKFTEAAETFEMLANKKSGNIDKAKAYHNLGNCNMKDRKWEKSIEAYKNALKNNPLDEDSRYNLAYSQKMLVQQQQNEKNKDEKDKNKNDKKEDDKNKKEGDKDKEKQENKNEQEQKKEDNKEKDKQQQKQQISKEDAQRLLDALQQNEKDIQEKLKKQKGKGVKVEVEKDW